MTIIIFYNNKNVFWNQNWLIIGQSHHSQQYGIVAVTIVTLQKQHTFS